MARKSVSNMTAEEKAKVFGKKKRFVPLFEAEESKPKKKGKKKKVEDKVDTKLDKVSRKKKPTTAKVDKVDKMSKPKRKKKSKTASMDKGLDKVSKPKKKKRSKKAERLNKKQLSERKAEEHKTVIKYKTLYDEEAYTFLIELYSKITQKKTKKEKIEDETGRSFVSSGLLLAIHEDAGKERFNMVGKLVEKRFAKKKHYATDYHVYEIFK